MELSCTGPMLSVQAPPIAAAPVAMPTRTEVEEAAAQPLEARKKKKKKVRRTPTLLLASDQHHC